jgi:glucan phosphoethanolaminetransferase (alkaline phosphatase superfamily)
MYNGLLHLHNLMRWVILLLLVVAIIKAFVGMSANRPFTKGDKQVSLFLMISAHITLLIGLYQWLAGRYGLLTTSLPPGTNLMKDSFYRFYWIEHPVGMILAVALITIGRAQTKKNVLDVVKHKKSFWYYMFALIVILVTVPWPFREIVGRPLFPGMH